jgi:uncharacterized protein YkwD
MRPAAIAAALLATLAGCTCNEPPHRRQRVADQVAADINDARHLRGMGWLKRDSELSAGAQAHAEWMARTRRFEHEPGYAEIIARGADTADHAVFLWEHSPPHRGIMLGPDYRRVGVGMARAEDGEAFWCARFR